MNSEPAFSPCLRLHADDNVVVARTEVAVGTSIPDGQDGDTPVEFTASEAIGLGHKVAARLIASGEPIRKYNQIIGFASQSIPAGTHVHSHNTEMRPFERDYAFGVDKKEDDPVATPATFAGYLRADSRGHL